MATADSRRPAKRGVLSCAECRRLKLKCDRAPWPSASTLADRVEQLEAIMKSQGLGGLVPPLTDAEVAAYGTASSVGARQRQMMDAMEAVENDRAGAGAGAQEEEDVEAIGAAVGSLTMRNDGSARFLGVGAALAYTGEDSSDSAEEGTDGEGTNPNGGGGGSSASLPRRISPPSTSHSSSLPPELESPGFPFIQLRNSLKPIQDLLPAKEEATRLAQVYWDRCAYMFAPICHETYWDDYFPTAFSSDPQGVNTGTKLACVFMTLSLGSIFDPSAPPIPSPLVHRFYAAGQAALSASRFLSHPTLAGIQAIHMSVNILFSRPNVKEGGEMFWPVYGLAIRAAQSMGLHRDPALWGLDEKEVERRRTTFWEVACLDRLQAFLNGRPYILQNKDFDTKMPTEKDAYHVERFKLSLVVGDTIDELFSVKPVTYPAIKSLDEKVRKAYSELPESCRCSALPEEAFSTPGSVPMHSPPNLPAAGESTRLVLQQHMLAILYSVLLLYLHKIPFSQALDKYAQEPLQSPFASSVTIVILEASAYIIKLVKSWTQVDEVVGPRWWNQAWHAFVAAAAQASLVIKSPGSMLAGHAWQQLNEACSLFENAAPRGPTYANLLPRIHLLRQKAHDVLVSVRHIQPTLVPLPPDAQAVELSELNALGTSTQLSRGRPRTATIKEEGGAVSEEAAAAALSLLQPAPWQTLDFAAPGTASASMPQYAHPQQYPQPSNPSQDQQQQHRPSTSDSQHQQHARGPFGYVPPGSHPTMPVYQPYPAPGPSMPHYLPSQPPPPPMYDSPDPALFGSQEAYRYATQQQQQQLPSGSVGPAGEMWFASGMGMGGPLPPQGPQDSWSLWGDMLRNAG
ncbi:hypothetical protein NBRC10512_005311 [Rhodotorula toruloides]|uniref:Transcription factor n=1 Tax=Rhodotorula toruloides (strain NP11) TaxID=1130832 RepID=M7XGG5_RHOT1|nr:transcription factor [Rhodotorula toruloides NP11]EMS22964.1 transcription factor [Rhodotorula toruloides NP11]